MEYNALYIQLMNRILDKMRRGEYPVSYTHLVIMQFLNTLLMSAYSGVMLSADKKIDALDFRGIRWCHYFLSLIHI